MGGPSHSCRNRQFLGDRSLLDKPAVAPKFKKTEWPPAPIVSHEFRPQQDHVARFQPAPIIPVKDFTGTEWGQLSMKMSIRPDSRRRGQLSEHQAADLRLRAAGARRPSWCSTCPAGWPTAWPTGGLDVALIPSIEFFHDPSYTIVSDACIACRGPVLSVKLFSRVPSSQIRTLALDEGSRTSAGLGPRSCSASGSASRRNWSRCRWALRSTIRTADAVLLIGDRAMHSPAGRFRSRVGPGRGVVPLDRLPFVFAMWVARGRRRSRRAATRRWPRRATRAWPI